MSAGDDPLIASEPVGPDAAAAIEVEAVPDTGPAPSGNGADASSPSSSATAPPDSTAEWAGTLVIVFGIGVGLAGRRWPSVKVEKEEVLALAGIWAPVCAKRWPIAMTPELVAIAATLAILGPKVPDALRDEGARRAQRRSAQAQRPSSGFQHEHPPAAAASQPGFEHERRDAAAS